MPVAPSPTQPLAPLQAAQAAAAAVPAHGPAVTRVFMERLEWARPVGLAAAPPANTEARPESEPASKRRKLDARDFSADISNFPALYNCLVDCERRLNECLKFKALSWRSVCGDPSHRRQNKHTLRVFVYNTVDKGVRPEEVAKCEAHPQGVWWTLKVCADVLDRPKNAMNPNLHFSDFVEKVIFGVDIATVDAGASVSVEWIPVSGQPQAPLPSHPHAPVAANAGPSSQADGFSMRRFCSDPSRVIPSSVPCKVLLYLRESPPRYAVSEPVRRLLDFPPARSVTSRELLETFWGYVEANGLVDGSCIALNPELRVLFGPQAGDRVPMSNVLDLLERHVESPKPILLTHHLSLSPSPTMLSAPESTAAQYDLAVEMEDPESLNEEFERFRREELANPQIEAARAQLNGEIGSCLRVLQERRARCDFLRRFCETPGLALQTFIDEQTRHLATVSKELDRDKERRSSYYDGDWLPEAITRFLASTRK